MYINIYIYKLIIYYIYKIIYINTCIYIHITDTYIVLCLLTNSNMKMMISIQYTGNIQIWYNVQLKLNRNSISDKRQSEMNFSYSAGTNYHSKHRLSPLNRVKSFLSSPF